MVALMAVLMWFNSDDDDNVDGDANSDIGGGQVKSERFMRQ